MGIGRSTLPFRPGVVCSDVESREIHNTQGRPQPQPLGERDRRGINGAGPLPIPAGLGPSAERGPEPHAIRLICLEVVAGWQVLGIVGVQGVLPRIDEAIGRQGVMVDQSSAAGKVLLLVGSTSAPLDGGEA